MRGLMDNRVKSTEGIADRTIVGHHLSLMLRS